MNKIPVFYFNFTFSIMKTEKFFNSCNVFCILQVLHFSMSRQLVQKYPLGGHADGGGNSFFSFYTQTWLSPKGDSHPFAGGSHRTKR